MTMTIDECFEAAKRAAYNEDGGKPIECPAGITMAMIANRVRANKGVHDWSYHLSQVGDTIILGWTPPTLAGLGVHVRCLEMHATSVHIDIVELECIEYPSDEQLHTLNALREEHERAWAELNPLRVWHRRLSETMATLGGGV
jgi:hypothetical protein